MTSQDKELGKKLERGEKFLLLTPGPNKTLHVPGDAVSFNDLSKDHEITSKLILILNNNACQDNNCNVCGQKLVWKELEYKQSDGLDVLLPSAQIRSEKITKKEMERLLSNYLAYEGFGKVGGRNAGNLVAI